GDPEITALLLVAAERTSAGRAVRFLQRALDERAPGDHRPTLLARLALAAADAERPDARERLLEALGEVDDTATRHAILLRLASLQALAGGDDTLLTLLDAEIASGAAAAGVAGPANGVAGPATAAALAVAALDVLSSLPDGRAELVRRLATLRSD